MIRLLYSTLVLLASSAASVFAPFNPKWKIWFAARKNTISISTSKKKIVIHCASHGEYEQTKLLANELKKNGYFLIFSFFSLSGQETIRKEKEYYDEIVFLPVDLPQKMEKFIQSISPSLFIINKYEYWYNLLHILDKKKVPFLFMNVNTDASSKYFKWPLRFLHASIRNSEMFFVNNAKSRNALERFGIENHRIKEIKDSRAASVMNEKEKQIAVPGFKNITRDIIIYASTHRSDIDVILHGIQSFPLHCHVIVPHEVDTTEIKFFKERLPAIAHTMDTLEPASKLILIDKIGILKLLYKYARVAYIGGGFGRSIHNTLEAIIEHVPVVGGPKSKGFEEIDYFRNNMYYSIFKPEEFATVVKRLLAKAEDEETAAYITAYFEDNNGIRPILDCIDKIINE